MGSAEQHKHRPISAPVIQPPPCYTDSQCDFQAHPHASPPPPAYHQSVHPSPQASHHRLPEYYYSPASSSYQQQPFSTGVYYYQPTPPPQTVIIQETPSRTNDACCWGCLAALCLCFAIEECC
ncbi:predicted protein [Lichtheimia corymbifera JMRC:FSU:9682]|uniref:Uncharacterized protein n=1 Tax=Lichtheimia corymbifera JMRC:FSU:9682 TaxID=1263082 RepID=A0A068RV58_9FUNG|nr:predicted protein [Lichtheimia corymbifera JMRC:FSU:9682]